MKSVKKSLKVMGTLLLLFQVCHGMNPFKGWWRGKSGDDEKVSQVQEHPIEQHLQYTTRKQYDNGSENILDTVKRELRITNQSLETAVKKLDFINECLEQPTEEAVVAMYNDDANKSKRSGLQQLTVTNKEDLLVKEEKIIAKINSYKQHLVNIAQLGMTEVEAQKAKYHNVAHRINNVLEAKNSVHDDPVLKDMYAGKAVNADILNTHKNNVMEAASDWDDHGVEIANMVPEAFHEDGSYRAFGSIASQSSKPVVPQSKAPVVHSVSKSLSSQEQALLGLSGALNVLAGAIS